MYPALVSVHDVMPETRAAVSDILYQLSRLERLPLSKITLLVVPGKDWNSSDIKWLQSLARAGYPMAGHGWSHCAPPPRTLYHWLHSLILSRRAAEHLSRDSNQLKQRVHNCYQWFLEHDLPAPELYVPPAWANGRLPWSLWPQRPFSLLETLSGVTDLNQGTTLPLPLTGYEADTSLRCWVLQRFNQWNIQQARRHQRPLRIGLHPFDLKYPLRHKAFQDIANASHFLAYHQLKSLRFAALSTPAPLHPL